MFYALSTSIVYKPMAYTHSIDYNEAMNQVSTSHIKYLLNDNLPNIEDTDV